MSIGIVSLPEFISQTLNTHGEGGFLNRPGFVEGGCLSRLGFGRIRFRMIVIVVVLTTVEK